MAMTKILLISALAVSQVLGHHSHAVYGNQSSPVSASTLIENGLTALGGEAALAAIQGVTYLVPE
jgi:hypothetical protein